MLKLSKKLFSGLLVLAMLVQVWIIRPAPVSAADSADMGEIVLLSADFEDGVSPFTARQGEWGASMST